MEVNIQLL